MKKFFTTIKNIFSIEDLRIRILNTLGFLVIFRLGSFVVLPGIDPSRLGEAEGIFGLLDTFLGGAFSNAAIFGLGIMPYISASIIMQLLGVSVPSVQKMQKDGESGRKKINNYTRILTIAICAVQAPAYLSMWVASRNALPTGDALNSLWWIQSVVVLVAGAMFG